MRLCASVIAIAVLAPLSAFAQGAPPPAAPAGAPPAEAAPPPPPPAAAPVEAAPAPAATPVVAAAPMAPPAKWYDAVVIDGLVDSYYMYNITGANSLVSPAIAQYSTVRSFDVASNSFSLNYAKVGLGIAPGPVGFRLDMGYGQTGVIVNSTSIPLSGLQPFLVQQAFASVVPVEGFTIDFGKFVTTAGAEVIESNKNWLYSRSLLFSVIPLLHEGLRLNYAVTKELTVQGSVINGWNGTGIESDLSKDKSFGVSINYNNAAMGLNGILTGYFGKESTFSNNTGMVSPDTRILIDLVLAYAVNNIGLNLNVDYLKDTGSGFDNLFGVAAMAHIPVHPNFAVNVRGEFVHNTVVGTAVNFFEGTLGGSVPFGGHFEFRPEFRFDGSNQQVFNIPTDPKKNQVTATGAFLAFF